MTKDDTLSKLELIDLAAVTIDAPGQTATVTFNVPHAGAGISELTETARLDSPRQPEYLRQAVAEVNNAMLRWVKERGVLLDSQAICAECTSACCARVFELVGVNAVDFARMGKRTARSAVELLPQPNPAGYVGKLKRVPYKGAGTAKYEGDAVPMACVFLDQETGWCTIYKDRPDICRTYRADKCEKKEPAPPKLIQLRKKALDAAPQPPPG